VYIGLWYVPSRNKASFEFNNPDIPEYLLYKVTQCEPQIWAFATGADTLAVACPSCLTMLTDAVKAEDLDGKLAVKDISQIVRESLLYK